MTDKMIPLRIVFDEASDGSPDLIFVEVETLDGKSVVAGTWEQYVSNGHIYQALRLSVPASDVQS